MVLGKTKVWLFELLPASFSNDDGNNAMMHVSSVFMMRLIMMMMMTVVLHPQMIGWAVKPPTQNNSQFGIWIREQVITVGLGFRGTLDIPINGLWLPQNHIMLNIICSHSLSDLTITKLAC